MSEVLERFPARRLVLVADRGLPSYDNIGEIEKLSGKDGRELEFILAVPARRYAGLAEAFREIDERKIGKVGKNGERLAEMEFAGHRLVVARDPERAKERTEKRKGRLGQLRKLAQEMAGRLDAAAAGQKIFGPGLAEQEARDRLADAVSGAKSRSSCRRGSPGAASAGPSTRPRSRRPNCSTASWRS